MINFIWLKVFMAHLIRDKIFHILTKKTWYKNILNEKTSKKSHFD